MPKKNKSIKNEIKETITKNDGTIIKRVSKKEIQIEYTPNTIGVENENETPKTVFVSYSNSKLKNKVFTIPTLNMPVGISCRKDAPCFKGCYAKKGRCAFHKDTYFKNYELYTENPNKFWDTIKKRLYYNPSRFFRWHSTGDIPDMEYLNQMIEIAKAFPETNFLVFTKKFELINEYLNTHTQPNNLVIILSSWRDWVPENPHNLPTAHVRFRKLTKEECGIPQSAFECTGNCADCVQHAVETGTKCSCWFLECGESVFFNEH